VVRKFLVSGVMIDDEYEDTIVGTPQGGLCRYPHKPPYAELVHGFLNNWTIVPVP
jgi:hypothetical protein